MLVTIVSDASFCVDTGAAGYGIWIACDRVKLKHGGQFKDRMKSSNEAEVCAIVNGIHHAIKTKHLFAGDSLVINTDCQAAIQLLNRSRDFATKREQLALQTYTLLVKNYRLKVYLKHVKGHTGRRDNRSLSNKYCDATAKENMKLARKALQK